MRTRTFVAAGVLALSAASVIFVACDDTTMDCTRGTLKLQVQLNSTAALADTITVQSYAPPFLDTFKRTPDGVPGEVVNVDVTFPAGYPSDKLVDLLVRGYGQGQLIGETLEQIHLLPVCTVGGATITTETLDASPADLSPVSDGSTD